MIHLAQYVDRPVLVASASLFGDERARECLLVGVEDIGVWLQQPDLVERVFADRARQAGDTGPAFLLQPVFVPYAQILFVAEVTNRVAASREPALRDATLAASARPDDALASPDAGQPPPREANARPVRKRR